MTERELERFLQFTAKMPTPDDRPHYESMLARRLLTLRRLRDIAAPDVLIQRQLGLVSQVVGLLVGMGEDEAKDLSLCAYNDALWPEPTEEDIAEAEAALSQEIDPDEIDLLTVYDDESVA